MCLVLFYIISFIVGLMIGKCICSLSNKDYNGIWWGLGGLVIYTLSYLVSI